MNLEYSYKDETMENFLIAFSKKAHSFGKCRQRYLVLWMRLMRQIKDCTSIATHKREHLNKVQH